MGAPGTGRRVVRGGSLRIAIVAGRYNEDVTRRLVAGATRKLLGAGVAPSRLEVRWVPGAFEIPGTARRLLDQGRHDAILCLGTVIRGETPHFDYVAGEATRGIGDIARRTGIPIGFGLLTCETEEQAFARAGGKSGNKGEDAARAALETARALAEFEGRAQT